jgi:hypothetical protein
MAGLLYLKIGKSGRFLQMVPGIVQLENIS